MRSTGSGTAFHVTAGGVTRVRERAGRLDGPRMEAGMDTIITDLTALVRDTWDCDDTVTVAPLPQAPETYLTATISGDAATSFYRGDLVYTFWLYESVRDDHTELRIQLDVLGAGVCSTVLVPKFDSKTYLYPDFPELMRDFLGNLSAAKRTLLRMRVRANRLQIKGTLSGCYESSNLVL